ncbi:MAG: glycosyltransferase [Bacteroidetes bacterium]|nr:MAG: glycosyltransferase [Bacteroidota bacterium]
MLYWIDTVVASVFGLAFSYLASLSVLALLAWKREIRHLEHERVFAVIIPAHNEALTLGKTLRSVQSVEYPKSRFDIHVIADNCSDQTAAIAGQCGAMVHERRNNQLIGKGYALQWMFDQILTSEQQYDAVVVIDADSVVSKNILTIMNNYLENGAHVIQVADVVAPQPNVWTSEIIRLAFTLYNVVRPLGKRLIGCSAGLRGNGMCFSTGTLRSVRWEAFSLTEDLEYGLTLLFHDIQVMFAPEATVVATMPSVAKHSESQRARWETGRFPVIKQYASRLLAGALRKRSLKLLDAVIDLVMPPFVNMLLLVTGFLCAHALLWTVGIEASGEYIWRWMVVWGIGVTHVLVGMLAVKADKLLFKALLFVPRYALWKVLLYGKLLLHGKPERWIRTEREPSA